MTRAAAVGLAGIFLLAACQGTPKGDIPVGYVSVPADGDSIRSAVAPTGNRIVVRRHQNPPEGTLEFWRDAVRAELTDGKGYTLAESAPFAGRGGRTGWEFLFEVTRTEAEYLYLVIVRVEGSGVFVTQAGGRADAMQKDLPALRDALR